MDLARLIATVRSLLDLGRVVARRAVVGALIVATVFGLAVGLATDSVAVGIVAAVLAAVPAGPLSLLARGLDALGELPDQTSDAWTRARPQLEAVVDRGRGGPVATLLRVIRVTGVLVRSGLVGAAGEIGVGLHPARLALAGLAAVAVVAFAGLSLVILLLLAVF